MGKLVNGQWEAGSVAGKSEDGNFHREEQSFRDYPSSEDTARDFHLYVSYACPWAHRTLIALKLKKLDPHINVSVVHPHMLDDGWSFRSNFDGATGDTLYNLEFLRDLYCKVDNKFTGKVTVPVLYNKRSGMIVNNESSDILRIFNSSFTSDSDNSVDLYPEELRGQIDSINSLVYENINNGVYKCGFATKQHAYNENVQKLFKALNEIESHLNNKSFLVGDVLTEADIRLFTTLIRFDEVYHTHFKCNHRLITQYENLSRYLEGLYSSFAFKSTTHFNHIKEHYYFSHKSINPYQIIPVGST